MYRKLLVGHLALQGRSLHVATVHLESIRQSASIRARQLEIIQRQLRRYESAVLVGDFNFCSSWPEESDNIDPDFQDVWPMLHGDEPGYTMNTAVNAMERDVKQEHKQVRFDRVVLRSRTARWRPTSIEIVGREPVSKSRPDVFPSDHFGLVARFEPSTDPGGRSSA
jgi:tyrosyl-DNA phosphodiesterase 2